MEIHEISINEFIDICKKKSIYCFGAGKAFTYFISIAKALGIEKQIMAVADNSPMLWGNSRIVDTKQISIISPPELINRVILDNGLIVITMRDSGEVLKQLKQVELLNDIYILLYSSIVDEYSIMCAQNISLPRSFRVSDKMLIPKKIHYCWFGMQEMPYKYLVWMDSWKKYCPDYEIIRWDEENYDVHKNKYMSDAYKARKWAFVSDYARLDIIYENGGIYLDTDVEVLKSLDDFLYEEAFAGCQQVPDSRVALGLGFGAIKGQQAIGELLDDYRFQTFVDFKTKAEKSKIKLCPDIQTQYLCSNGWKYENTITEYKGLRIYPCPVLCGKVSGRIIDNGYTYTIHHFDGSWVPKK